VQSFKQIGSIVNDVDFYLQSARCESRLI